MVQFADFEELPGVFAVETPSTLWLGGGGGCGWRVAVVEFKTDFWAVASVAHFTEYVR